MRRIPYTKLSKNTEYIHPNYGYKVVSLPEGMEIAEDGSFRVTKKIPVVVILDRFLKYPRATEQNRVSIECGTTPGELVTKYAVNGLEEKVGVLAIEVVLPWRLDEALKSLIEMQQQYQNIAAVNLSLIIPVYFNDFCKKYGISKYDLKQKKEKVIEVLNEEDAKYFLEYVRLINELVDTGVEVYIRTGNKGYNYFNGLNLSKAHAVSDKEGDYDNELLLATCSANGTHSFRRKFDRERKRMYITDGNIRFYREEFDHPWIFRLFNIFYVLALPLVIWLACWSYFTGFDTISFASFIGYLFYLALIIGPMLWAFFKPLDIRGASFATPMKLNEDLKAKLK